MSETYKKSSVGVPSLTNILGYESTPMPETYKKSPVVVSSLTNIQGYESTPMPETYMSSPRNNNSYGLKDLPAQNESLYASSSYLYKPVTTEVKTRSINDLSYSRDFLH